MHRHIGKRTLLSAATLLALAAGAAQAQQNDPLYRYQWHLMNYGQSALGDTKPAFGVDLGIDDLHDYNIRGKGVIVGVLDEGVEIAHPDLAANMVPDGSKNFDDGSHDTTPTTAGNAHGMQVAGIIAAVGWNGIGVRGVAPSAKIKSFNGFGDGAGGELTEEEVTYAWWDGAESKDVAISNNSWGSSNFRDSPGAPFSENEVDATERSMSATRNGLGMVYVKAAGNGFNTVRIGEDTFNCNGTDAARTNVGCTQAGWDSRNNLFNVITVAAVNAAGKRSSYSSPGAALWVSGLGGEYGHQAAYDPGLIAVAYDPAIVTTDLAGCARGANNNDDALNALTTDASAIDATCNYSGTMNGTSAATPTVSGVTALVLQANPKLSFRDVKYILATTARQIDPHQPAAVHSNGTVLVPGWTRNAAGRYFSNWYGFGLVDASMAVEVAGKFKPLPRLLDSGWQRVAPEGGVAIGGAAAPARLRIDIGGDIRKVEGVQLGFEANHSQVSWLSAPLSYTLISPSGTRSTVMPAMALRPTDSYGFVSSNAFLDEVGTGTWTLEVADVPLAAGAASQGTLTSFKIRVLGH